jgi:hypothetical protein
VFHVDDIRKRPAAAAAQFRRRPTRCQGIEHLPGIKRRL